MGFLDTLGYAFSERSIDQETIDQQTYVSSQVQYIVNDQGQRKAVVLKWEDCG